MERDPVLRPTSTWAAALVALGVAGALAGFAEHGPAAGFEAMRPADAGFWYWVGLASRSLAFARAAVEAALCHRRRFESPAHLGPAIS